MIKKNRLEFLSILVLLIAILTPKLGMTAKAYSAATADGITRYAALQDLACPSPITMLLDGKPVALTAYALKDAKGNSTNYLRIRDVATILTGTPAQFWVGWNGRVSATPGKAYEKDGSELSVPFSGNQAYVRSDCQVNIGSRTASLDSLLLTDSVGKGYTYFKLRDLGKELNFTVDWDATTGSIVLNTGARKEEKPTVTTPHIWLMDMEYTNKHILTADEAVAKAKADAKKLGNTLTAVEIAKTRAKAITGQITVPNPDEFSAKDGGKDNLGQSYAYSVGSRVSSGWSRSYALNGQYGKLTGTLYQKYEERSSKSESLFKVYADGNLVYSKSMAGGIEPLLFDIPLDGVLELKITFSGTDAVLGDCGFYLSGSAPTDMPWLSAYLHILCENEMKTKSDLPISWVIIEDLDGDKTPEMLLGNPLDIQFYRFWTDTYEYTGSKAVRSLPLAFDSAPAAKLNQFIFRKNVNTNECVLFVEEPFYNDMQDGDVVYRLSRDSTGKLAKVVQVKRYNEPKSYYDGGPSDECVDCIETPAGIRRDVSKAEYDHAFDLFYKEWVPIKYVLPVTKIYEDRTSPTQQEIINVALTYQASTQK